MDTKGNIITVAGNGNCCFGGDGGPATSAEIVLPEGLTTDTSGNLFFADSGNNRVREVFCVASGSVCAPPPGLAAGDITTVAGNGGTAFSGDGGPATSAELHRPTGVAVDVSGNLLIADELHSIIRKVDQTGTITSTVGTLNCCLAA